MGALGLSGWSREWRKAAVNLEARLVRYAILLQRILANKQRRESGLDCGTHQPAECWENFGSHFDSIYIQENAYSIVVILMCR